MFTVAYSAIGIPLALIMFQSIGERMNKLSSVIIQKLRTWMGCRQKEATELDLIFSSLFFSFISISGGTVLYSTQEGWTYFESCYYCFITLTTIGFGDFVALQQHRSLTLRPGYVVASFCFLLWGLSAVASSINLLVLKFMTISLEEEEQGEDELHEMGANIITVDEEVIRRETRGKGLYLPQERDTMSVCSCTCYPQPRSRGRASMEARGQVWRRLMCWMGLGEDRTSDNFYDSETQSISNYTKLAVKRSSF